MEWLQNMDWLQLLRCFCTGGIICVIGQILIDKPYSLTPFIAPLARLYPKPVRGTVAPAPAKSTRYW